MIIEWVSSFSHRCLVWHDIRSSQLFRHGYSLTKLSVGDCRSSRFSSQKETNIYRFFLHSNIYVHDIYLI
ncbi:hypothetical protein Hdeb2414_s0005g00159291 [Helianthus debilis subsp. tardiflorus]